VQDRRFNVGLRGIAFALAVAFGCGAHPLPGERSPSSADGIGSVSPAASSSLPGGRLRASPAASLRGRPPPAPPPPVERRAILVTVDGVRWQDVFEGATASLLAAGPRPDPARERGEDGDLTRPEGLLPRTWELVGRSGVALGHGAGCGPVRPRNTTHISLPGYFEIFSGRRTTCMSNGCATIGVPTVLDVAADAGLSAASLSSWEMLDRAVTRRPGAGAVFVSAGIRWPGPRPVEDPRFEAAVVEGERAKPFPAPGGIYRPDRQTIAIALEYLRVRRPRLLHVGLGDTDEHAHRDDYPAYLVALREIDTFLGDLAEGLEVAGLFATTAVLVVSDHGRASSSPAVFREHGAAWPESGRSFVIAFGGLVPQRGEACAVDDLWLTDIAPTLRALLGLPQDPASEAIGRPIREIVDR
jgi:hypothetical protein